MKRYFLTPYEGNGTFANPYRTTIDTVSGVNWAQLGKSDPNTGVPVNLLGEDAATATANSHPQPTCFVIAGKVDLSAVLQVSNTLAFPDQTLDTIVSSLSSDAQQSISQGLQVRGYDYQFFGQSDSYQSVLEHVEAQLAGQSVSIYNLDVAEAA